MRRSSCARCEQLIAQFADELDNVWLASPPSAVPDYSEIAGPEYRPSPAPARWADVALGMVLGIEVVALLVVDVLLAVTR